MIPEPTTVSVTLPSWTLVVYLAVGLVLAYVTIRQMRSSAYAEYPDQDHDSVSDWLGYLFIGGAWVVMWPLLGAGFLFAFALSRYMKAQKEKP